ncbi:MAG: hypothetical protein ACOC56_00355 [Atribacterota bacterium]
MTVGNLLDILGKYPKDKKVIIETKLTNILISDVEEYPDEVVIFTKGQGNIEEELLEITTNIAQFNTSFRERIGIIEDGIHILINMLTPRCL